mgnify:CR=1 FL=1
MRNFYEEYINWSNRPSDFNEHMPTLYNLMETTKNKRSVEFGVGFGQSTRAFLAALEKIGGTLRSYDIVPHEGILELFADAQEAGIDAKFIQESTLDCTIEETDILLVDSHHTYEQVKGELRDEVTSKVTSYIIFHDTELFGDHGQDPGSRGILPAINEFLETHPEWAVKEKYTNNNGLWILWRVL